MEAGTGVGVAEGVVAEEVEEGFVGLEDLGAEGWGWHFWGVGMGDWRGRYSRWGVVL